VQEILLSEMRFAEVGIQIIVATKLTTADSTIKECDVINVYLFILFEINAIE
jgi:hypothetical protein